MKAKGMPLGHLLRQKLVSTTLSALKRLANRGSIEKIGEGVRAMWRLAKK
jgi:hypothetical protein